MFTIYLLSSRHDEFITLRVRQLLPLREAAARLQVGKPAQRTASPERMKKPYFFFATLLSSA
ncbi:MAG: hypothetical protein HC773_07495 [Scytonema sp. CRU_2_7]|nr:hypothetical protein [Scytonema sp. CRU_2_7]